MRGVEGVRNWWVSRCGVRQGLARDGKSFWSRAVTPGYRSIREHPFESQPPPGFHSMHTSAVRGVVCANYRVEKPIRLRSVSSPHENDRLSWPNRQIVRRASDDTELETP
jgi:hypothetical protein